jgi:NADPH-dependent 2,4-dienoyl-CoA reductase/sulfur reductase-like enzyme
MVVTEAINFAQSLALAPIKTGFHAWQWTLDKALSPRPPSESGLPDGTGPRVAVIGAGITGVTAAAHCIGHGFDVTIFEAGERESLGGIWSVSSSRPLGAVVGSLV